MRSVISLMLAVGLGANGVWMLTAPASWYGAIPGVAETGPANMHFIRDLGAAYLVVAACISPVVIRSSYGRPAAFASGIFLVLHALVHIWEAAAGRESLNGLLRDFPGVVLPAILTLWLAWPPDYLRRGVQK